MVVYYIIHFGLNCHSFWIEASYSLEMEVELDLKKEMKEVDCKVKTVESLDEEEIAGKLNF